MTNQPTPLPSGDRLEACRFCGNAVPDVVSIKVHYDTPRKQGPHDMQRVACPCGTIGKCRPDRASAIESWNEPWQALAEHRALYLASLAAHPEPSGDRVEPAREAISAVLTNTRGCFRPEEWGQPEDCAGGNCYCVRVARDAARAALSAAPNLSPPSGWVMVPREPTPDMIYAGEQAINANIMGESGEEEESGAAYKAMLATAPSPPLRREEELSDFERRGIAQADEVYPDSGAELGDDMPDQLPPLRPLDGVAKAIYQVLRNYRLTNIGDEDGEGGYPLVDAVSNEAPATIETGEEQLRDLAGEIAFALSAVQGPDNG